MSLASKWLNVYKITEQVEMYNKSNELDKRLKNLRENYDQSVLKRSKSLNCVKNLNLESSSNKKMNNNFFFLFKKKEMEISCHIFNNGKIPILSTSNSAAYDLFCPCDFTIEKHSVKKINLGLCIDLPDKYCAVIRPRSGLALEFIDIGGGLIDSDYKKEIAVIMYNHSEKDRSFKQHDRIAQLKIERNNNKFTFVYKKRWDSGERGGFGSTGN